MLYLTEKHPKKMSKKLFANTKANQVKLKLTDALGPCIKRSLGVGIFTDKSDARVVAAVLKAYLESLPEPVILSSLYYEFNSNSSKPITI